MSEEERPSPEAEVIIDVLAEGDEERRKKLGINIDPRSGVEIVEDERSDERSRQLLKDLSGPYWPPSPKFEAAPVPKKKKSDDKDRAKKLGSIIGGRSKEKIDESDRDYGDEDQGYAGDKSMSGGLNIRSASELDSTALQRTEELRKEADQKIADLEKLYRIIPEETWEEYYSTSIRNLLDRARSSILREADLKMMLAESGELKFLQEQIEMIREDLRRLFERWEHAKKTRTEREKF